MNYTEAQQGSLDLDWFALDEQDYVVFFTSGGGELPKSILRDKESNELLRRFFRELPEITINVGINHHLYNMVELTTLKESRLYLSDSIKMSRKGLVCFDISPTENGYRYHYHRVCTPENLLKIDQVPEDIKALLSKTRIKGTAAGLNEIDVRLVT